MAPAEHDDSNPNQTEDHEIHQQLLADCCATCNTGLRDELCFHDPATKSHRKLSEVTVEEIQSWKAAPDALAELYSIWEMAKHCPDNKFPTVSICYPPDGSVAKELDQLGEQIGDLQRLSNTTLNALPLDYTSDSLLAPLRSQISSSFGKALCPDFTNRSDTTVIDSNTVDAMEKLKSGSVSANLCEINSLVNNICSSGLAVDWLNRSVLLSIEQAEGAEHGECSSGWHRHRKEMSV